MNRLLPDRGVVQDLRGGPAPNPLVGGAHVGERPILLAQHERVLDVLGNLPEPHLALARAALLDLELLLGAPELGEVEQHAQKVLGVALETAERLGPDVHGTGVAPHLVQHDLATDGGAPGEGLLPMEVKHVGVGGRHERRQLSPDEPRAIEAEERGRRVVGLHDRAREVEVQVPHRREVVDLEVPVPAPFQLLAGGLELLILQLELGLVDLELVNEPREIQGLTPAGDGTPLRSPSQLLQRGNLARLPSHDHHPPQKQALRELSRL